MDIGETVTLCHLGEAPDRGGTAQRLVADAAEAVLCSLLSAILLRGLLLNATVG